MQGSNLRLVAAATAQKFIFADVVGLVIFNFYLLISVSTGAISSVVEHLLHTQGVAGSIPASRTVDFPKAEKTARRFKTKVTTIIWGFIPQRFTNLDAAREGF